MGSMGKLPLLGVHQVQKLWDMNHEVPPAVERTLHGLFEEQAKDRPLAPALHAWDGEMTYSQLDETSTRLASYLATVGIKAEELVLLCFEKSLWTVVAMLAVLKAGGAFVPLDPEHPSSRHQEILRQTKAKVVLTSVQHQKLWADLPQQIVAVGNDFVSKLPRKTVGVCSRSGPSNTVYVMFTSGSTGTPKGVVLEHRAVATSCLAHGKAMLLSSSARAFQFTAYTFDICIAEIFTTLIFGGCVCIPSDKDRRNALSEAINRMDVNWAQLTPTVARLLDPQSTPSLKVLVLGGERVDSADWERWSNYVAQIRVYGPTECSIWCSSHHNGAQEFQSGTIGKPMASVHWIVDQDDHNELAPMDGAVGELLIEGPILARGYLNDAAKTEASFISNPRWLLQGSSGRTGSGRHGRLYKTGDLVYYNADGYLVYAGRKDGQVKVHGQRVELGEIEHHLRNSIPSAKQIAVEVIRPTGAQEKAMVAAFLQLNEEAPWSDLLPDATMSNGHSGVQVVSLNHVDIQLGQQIPHGWIPEVYFVLDDFPLTTSAKVDRVALRKLGGSFSAQQLAQLHTSMHSSGPKRGPTSDKEKTMQQLWASVLGINDSDSIGMDDSFFHLGGDSIAAMRLVGEARRSGIETSVTDVFRNPTLEQLTCSVTFGSQAASSCVTIPHSEISGPVTVPQSFAQGRLWFLEELHPGLNWYLIPFAVRIRGPLQLEALKFALWAIEERHETLRTTFDTIADSSVQVIHPFRAKELNIVNVLPGDTKGLADAIQQDQTRPFNLRTEPGWRVTLYSIGQGQNDHVLSIVIHHIVADGWSTSILMSELAAFYSTALHGQSPLSPVQPLTIQYRDFSIWEKQQAGAQVDRVQKQLAYWVSQLDGSRPATLLCDKARPDTLSGQAGRQKFEIGASLYAALQQFCGLQGVTQFMVLLAAFRATHFRLTGQQDATIATVNANRDRWELKDMIGFFVNLQCLRTTIGNEESFEDLARQVRAVTIAALANNDVPFESIVSKLKLERSLSRHPLAQIMFAVHSQRDLGELTLHGLETETLDDTPRSRFDIECHFFQKAEGLEAKIFYSTDLYAPETIESMIRVFLNVIERCLAEPKAIIATLPLLHRVDYSKLDGMGLIPVKDIAAYPRELSVVDMFRQQVSVCPSRVALMDTSVKMTYAQLDEESDILARWLATQSLTPETLVGVLASRSCQTIVAFLGILKANLAYLPFDVKLPAKRIQAIISSLPPGRKIVLVGADVRLPDVKLEEVDFVSITDALKKQTSDLSAASTSREAIVRPCATSLAYVMFTSGSTGQPKGVMIEHRGIVHLVSDNHLTQHLPASPVMAHMTTLTFDTSTWEIYAALLHGGTLVCIDAKTVLDPEAVLRTFRQEGINTAFMTPSLFRTYVSQWPAVFAGLDMLCLGGEALHPKDMLSIKTIETSKVVNGYGPTEITTFATSFLLSRDKQYVNGVPIGRAISSNAAVYVMDPKLQLVPLGVIGELVVTGDGLARGYTDPKRNVDRFVTVEIGNQTVKAYRTGDFVRYRPEDGQLEFFGRIDGQVKIRGHRIECGEVDHVLRSHKSVIEAVTVLQRSGNDARLAAFVTVRRGDPLGSIDGHLQLDDESQLVDTWEEQFDSNIYQPISGVHHETLGRDFIGWTSMYDGSELDKSEMNEWLDDTINTILDGHQPGKVLEVGTGTGMILFNLGEGLEYYIGLEPSQKAVEFVSKTAGSMPALAGKVRMHKATAADLGRIEPPCDASLVVINSVVQYFPSLDYLFKTVQQLLELESVSTLFIGDVRSYALHREFLATRALRIAGDKASKADIRRIVADMEEVERELLVDPAFFTALQSRLSDLVEHVEILPKRMKATNELSCYRYAAIIHARSPGRREREQVVQYIAPDEWIDFAERKLDRQSLLTLLKSCSCSSAVAVSNIPYSKTIVSRCLVDSLDVNSADQRPVGTSDDSNWLSSVYQQAQHRPSLSVTDLHELAQQADFRVETSWSRQHSQRGGLDAIFHRYQPREGEGRVKFQFPTESAERPAHSLSSRPLQQESLQRTQKELQDMLETHLPAYMVPQSITFLDAMPTNQSGKVDRRALEERFEMQTAVSQGLQRELTAAEVRMQQLIESVLGINHVGLYDSFFQLGGDSIAAMRLVGAARQEGLGLSVADIFKSPKLVDLAAVAQEQGHVPSENVVLAPFSLLTSAVEAAQVRQVVAASCNVEMGCIEDVYPCSPLQEGFLSLTEKRAGDYVMQAVLELRAGVDEGRLKKAWETAIQTIPILRTRIVYHDTLGLVQAVVADKVHVRWAEASDGVQAYLGRDKISSMRLGQPLARYAIIRSLTGGKRWFVWTIHHAIYDGWSLPHILNAVDAAYNDAELPKLPGYNHFINYLGQLDHDTLAAYWRATLGGCEAKVFPLLPPGTQQPVADTTAEFRCPPLPQGTRLSRGDTTIPTLLRAAWAIVQSRYTSSDDVVFGATVTGRNAPVVGIEYVVGPVIATVPVRMCLRGESTVPELLEAVQRQATDMIPFEQTGLQRIARLGPDMQHACRFQTLLIVQPTEDAFHSNDALGTWQYGSELQDFTTYALMIQCKLDPEGVSITASFDARLIETWQVDKMLAQLGFVVQQLAQAGPSTKVKDIDLVTPSDRQQLWKWNDELPPAMERCVHDLYSEQAKMQPHALAVDAWDGRLTYEELDEVSSRLAAYLTTIGVKPESMVPLCFEKSKWVVVAMLAVLKAGGAFVPLAPPPEHPVSRHKEIFEQTKAKVVLASEQYATLWPVSNALVVPIGQDFVHQLANKRHNTQTAMGVHPNNPAYIIFTSGSTGIPKGVVLEHQAVSTECLAQKQVFGITKDTRSLQFASYTFDACIPEIITTLIHGGCVCIPSKDEQRNDLINTMNKMQVNWALLTPAVARMLDPQKITSLRTLVLGAEKVNTSDCKRWGDRVQLVNAFGPTECCVACAANPSIGRSDLITIGKSFASASWVVDPDDHNRLAPMGATGELLVEGPILARGYLGDAKRTEDAFIETPPWLSRGSESCGGRQGRLYKTGDLVRYREDGELVYISRKDNQVKVRGQRVELGEIEHHLYQCVPDIRQMAAEIFVPTGGRPMVAAFLETNPEQLGGKTTDDGSAVHIVFPTRLEEELARRLPQQMMPEVFFAVKEMPTTTSSKIDRRRLRELAGLFSAQQLADLRTKGGQDSKRQPESEREKLLQRLWAQVLSIDAEHIGLADNFFRLGGDSIAAMKLVNEARNAGLNISVQNVFEAQRLGQLANQSVPSLDDTRDGSVIPKANQDGPVAQSFAQGRLWFLEQLHPGLYWYLVHLAVRIRGPLQLHALQAALHAVEGRHETLRTTFSTKNGEGLQQVHPFLNGKELKVIDVCSDDDHILAKALRQEQMTPFNLESEPGWRVKVFRVNEQYHVLSIVMHHIVADGWSVDNLKTELSALYAAVVRGHDPVSHLPPLPVQYRDFSLWQRLPSQVQEHQRQLAYWTSQLNASRPAEFLCDKPRPATLSGKAGTQELEINSHLYENIQRFARARGVTVFTILFAAFRAAHYRLTGQDDATIGVPNANRAQWEVGKLIGFFVNMQCLRIKIQDETFEELVHQVHTTTVAALANQEVPFESVVSALQGDRDLSRNPLAQVAFAVHSQKDVGKLEFEGTETEAIETLATTRFDLECHFFQGQGTMQGYIYFAEELFAADSMRSLASVFMSLLENCLDKPETRISLAPLMTDRAYTHLNDMGLLRSSRTPYSRDSSIIDVFQQQAVAQPSKIAVRDACTELTYSQLDALSDKLASFLAMKSIAPETAVGVLAHRSCQAIVALLGILKAGLAYLPFDPKAPEHRMRSILSSIQGNTLVLVGQNVEPPIGLESVEFAHIVEILDAKGDPECTRRKLDLLRPRATSLAYILFTSGSTGQPKGVMVEHRGLVRLAQHEQVKHFLSAEATAHMANLAFDGSSWEIYTCLLNGGTLVCIDSDTVLDQDALLRAFVQYQVRIAFITPALLNHILAKSPETIGNLETLLVAGDKADRDDLFKARSLVKRHVVANAYGPTENSVMSTLYILPEDEPCVNGVPIGRTISNSAAYVMDAEQRLVPLGVVGELVVTGDGVARGYTNPERNADRFVTVTIGNETSGKKTMRAYRTGDYVRQRPTDGSMEFFGRIDGQVKIRGIRVEMGEIESVLRSHDLVRDAVVVADHRDDNNRRLFGYVTLKEGSEIPGEENGDDNQVRHVTAWEDRFDSEQYATMSSIRADTRIGQDFIGWTSMYDGSDIPRDQMIEWLNETIDSIHSTVGGQLGSVLEIGSGSGMILFNLRKSLKKYTGFEPSRNALNFVVESAKSMASLANKVEMYKATAADISQVKNLQADLIILNSVVQYFPSQEYLFKVVQDLLLHVDGAQAIFFGDVRSYAMQGEFLATRAACMAGKMGSKETLQRMIEDMERIERELLVDPGFFTSLTYRLPHLVQHVEIRPKKMRVTNELSCYRYTAVVYTSSWGPPGGELRSIPDKEWIDFQEQKLDRGSLQQQLENISAPMAISNIPYSKTLFGRCLLRFLLDDKATKPVPLEWEPLLDQEAGRIPSLSAVDLDEIAKGACCDVQISWNRQYSQHGGLDAIFYPRQIARNGHKAAPMFQFPTDHMNRRQQTFSNQPLRQQLDKEVQQQLDQLVRRQLPSYMVPQCIHVLDKLPINQNGKVDRTALLSRTRTDTPAATSQNSQQRELSSSELKVQQLLARVLDIHTSRIGLDDSFFQLGGDSISAMKLAAAAGEDGIRLTVADVFKHPRLVDLATVALSAQQVDAEKPTQPFSLISPTEKDHLLQNIPAASNVDRNDVADIYPATWMQNLYISRGVSTRPLAFNYFYLDLGSRVDASRLRRSLSLLLKHFATLRTKFAYVDGKLWAIVLRDPEVSFTEFELDASLDEASNACCLQNSQTSDALQWPTAFFLVRSGNGQHRLVIRISHACYDGVCFPSYLKTLLAFYFGEPVDPSHDFQTYLTYKHGTKSASTQYWRTLLGGSRMTQATPVLGSKLGSESVDVYTERVITMPQLPKDITLASLNSAAWAKVLNHVTGEQDVVYGTMIAGRNSNIPTITKIVGPCVNIIPVRARVHPTTTAAKLVRSIQEQFIALGEADSMEFDELVRDSTDWPGDTHFDSVFQHQGLNEHPEYVFEGINTKLHWFQNPESIPCILTVVSFPLGDKLKIVVRGNERIITPENADMIRDKLCEMIHELASSLQ